MSLLKLEHLEVNYGAVRALKNVSLEVREGEVVALLGANGAGKSTTLKAISALIKAKAGSISYAGQNISKLNPTQIVALGISHSPEGRRVFPRHDRTRESAIGAQVNAATKKTSTVISRKCSACSQFCKAAKAKPQARFRAVNNKCWHWQGR